MSDLKRKILKTAGVLGLNSLAGALGANKVYCVGYHSISSPKNTKELSGTLYHNLSISEEMFEKQVAFLLAHGHTIVPVSGLIKAVEKGVKKPTAIYFDDGYRDNLLNALPILKKYEIPATVFVITGVINRTHVLWTLALRSLYAKTRRTFEDAELAIMNLKEIPAHEALKEVEKEYERANIPLDPTEFNMILDWGEVRELAEAGVEIGSHTVSHPNLARIDRSEVAFELEESKREIERRISRKIISFSYPYGRPSETVIGCVREAGYEVAVSGTQGWNSFEEILEHPLEVKKIAPRPGRSLADFSTLLYATSLLKSL